MLLGNSFALQKKKVCWVAVHPGFLKSNFEMNSKLCSSVVFKLVIRTLFSWHLDFRAFSEGAQAATARLNRICLRMRYSCCKQYVSVYNQVLKEVFARSNWRIFTSQVGLDNHIYDNSIKLVHLCTLKLEVICSFLHVTVFATPQMSNN